MHTNIPSSDKDTRPLLTPINAKYARIWELHELQRNSYWLPTEFKHRIPDDRKQYDSLLSPAERRLVEVILAFFSRGDKLINCNIGERLLAELEAPELKICLRYQMMMEDIHDESYSLLLNGIITNSERRNTVLDSVVSEPAIKDMYDWMENCRKSTESLAQRMFRVACFEGIFFQGLFYYIQWLGVNGKMGAMGISNEMISRDENIHTEIDAEIFKLCVDKPDLNWIHEKAAEAKRLAVNLTMDAVKEPMVGLSREFMNTWSEYQTDHVLRLVGYPPLYDATLPDVAFMSTLHMKKKSNFFETTSTDYTVSIDTEDVGEDW